MIKSTGKTKYATKRMFIDAEVRVVVANGEKKLVQLAKHTDKGTTVEIQLYNPDHTKTVAKARAGGYGYHRMSAATETALNNLGYELEESISGRGNVAMEEALVSLVQFLYPEDKVTLLTICY